MVSRSLNDRRPWPSCGPDAVFPDPLSWSACDSPSFSRVIDPQVHAQKSDEGIAILKLATQKSRRKSGCRQYSDAFNGLATLDIFGDSSLFAQVAQLF
jgi:hypothetical protein